jgi:methylmalonyl-CoA mutase N-terminal domain/subunit
MITQEIKSRYFQGARRKETWSGIPLKTVYTPEDIKDIDYARSIGNPGEYPYRRGIYPDMYRGRLWSQRQITGCPTPKMTNERLRYLLSSGESAINIIGDQPTQIGIDSDHPWAEGSVGRVGVPVDTMEDMRQILDGIPLDQVSTMLTLVTPIALPSYMVLAEEQGIAPSELRATSPMVPPVLGAPVCMYGGREWWFDMAKRQMKEFIDKLEYMNKKYPKIYVANYNAYNIRETGVGAAEEVAWIFANAFEGLKLITERGVDIDAVAPKVSITFSVMVDIFEEAAKFRAARAIWARTLKEKFGAKDPRSLRLKYHVNTAGIIMERQQATINVIRAAYAALAAVLGGTQSLQVAGYDEPIAIPTEEAATLAVRTQQILANETGVATVADPLAGSYYVESLTGQLEEKMQKILDTIEEKGGMTAAIHSGYIDREMEAAWFKYQKEVEAKERIVVGVNEFTIPEEQDADVAVYLSNVDFALVQSHIEGLKEFKRTRDQAKVKKALENMLHATENDAPDICEYEKECCKAGCTTGELNGVKRMGIGLPYDPLGVLEYPFS